jgi:hypothetical protein
MSKIVSRSAFSKRCYDLVKSKLEAGKAPIELRLSNDYGWGLYATRDIGHTEVVLREDPILDYSKEEDWFRLAYFKASRGTKYHIENGENNKVSYHDELYGVATMINATLPVKRVWELEEVLEELDKKIPTPVEPDPPLPRPSEDINWLGLCWTIDSTTGKPPLTPIDDDIELNTTIIGRMFEWGNNESRLTNFDWWGVNEYALLLSKLRTNAIGTALYIVASKFNHSCIGNVAWHPLNPEGVVIAMKPIKKGDQLFYNYHGENKNMPRDERRSTLKKHFGFDCNCALCQSGR